MNGSWLVVAGDLTPLGGMDRANYALARYLADQGRDVHLVTHRAWPDLAKTPSITLHTAWRPFGRHALGGPILAREGRRVWRGLARSRDARAVVNGGNCDIHDVNWVHYLHAAYDGPVTGSAARQAKARFVRQNDLRAERAVLTRARVIICNSRRTRADVVERLSIPESRVQVVYYGSDPAAFSFVDADTRSAAKRALGRPADRPIVGFVGALGDSRKAFDSIFTAWRSLSRMKTWDADLVAVGAGAELPAWRARARAAGLDARMTFLGFRQDVPDVMAAFDALVHPARYEAYGLSVHESLCRGIPALVSARAGVAEMYPPELGDLLITDPNDARELEERLLTWRRDLERVSGLVKPVSSRLRARTWDHMAREIVERVEAGQA